MSDYWDDLDILVVIEVVSTVHFSRYFLVRLIFIASRRCTLLELCGPLRLDCGDGFTMQREEVIPAGTSRIRMPLFPNVANFARRRAPRNMLGHRDALFRVLGIARADRRERQNSIFIAIRLKHWRLKYKDLSDHAAIDNTITLDSVEWLIS